MIERRYSAIFSKYLKERAADFQSAAFELKVAKGALPFSAVKEHQEQALWHVKHDKLVWKIADCGYQNCFDYFLLAKAGAYVAIKYPGLLAIIDIDVWLKEKKQSKRRSLTEERAKKLCTVFN